MLMTGADVLHAKVTLPSIFSDNMVLQQKTDAAVWGKASPGEEVTVSTSWSAKTYTCKAGDDGKWKLYVKTPKACTGQWVCVEGENKLRIENVLVGEVWLCTGQSNMEFPVAHNPKEKWKSRHSERRGRNEGCDV